MGTTSTLCLKHDKWNNWGFFPPLKCLGELILVADLVLVASPNLYSPTALQHPRNNAVF